MSTIDSSALATLRAALSPSAAAHLPSDLGYSVERWALNSEKQAALVVCPATVDDILQVLSFAQGRAPFQSQKPLGFTVKVCIPVMVMQRVPQRALHFREAGSVPQVLRVAMAALSSIFSRKCTMSA